MYWRAGRAYGDFRDLGGGREALCLPGKRWAVTDPDIAAKLATDRVKELDARQRGIALQGSYQIRATLKDYVRDHLIKKAQTGKYNPRWLAGCQLYLDRAIAFLGAGKGIYEIGVPEVQAWLDYLRRQPTRRGEPMTNATLRWHLNALSNLYRRAQSEHLVPPGYNPVAAMLDKPAADPQEARWLEPHEAALLLEAARVVPDLPPYVYPLVATLLLTGGRRAEVLGLEVADLSFDRRTITFRKNASRRRLKTRTSQRTIPMWPQLEKILRPYVFSPDRPPSRLLFPSRRGSGEAMLTDFRKPLLRISLVAGFTEPVRRGGEVVKDKQGQPELRSTIGFKTCRHTYCCARLATLDRGAPVSQDTVARELGHSSTDLVQEVYGHLGTVRHRSEEVEYRVEQHREILGERLEALYRLAKVPFGTVSGTTAVSAA